MEQQDNSFEYDADIQELNEQDKNMEHYSRKFDNDRKRKMQVREFIINASAPPGDDQRQ